VKIAAIVSKPAKPELAAIVPEALRWLAGHNYRVYVDQQTVAYAAHDLVVARAELAQYKPEFVLVLGGDGTLLSAARAIGAAQIPLLAVNLGSLGFLTEVRLDELYTTLDAADEGRCPVESRSVLDCRLLRGGLEVAHYNALNDAVIKSTVARLIGFELCINGEHVVEYQADGGHRGHSHRLYGVLAGGRRPSPGAQRGSHFVDSDLSALAHASSPGGGR